jgi:uncharacterized membrane protein YfhO
LNLVNNGPEDEVVIEGLDSNQICKDGGTAFITLGQETAQNVSVRVNAVEKGWLLMTDTWYPGWEATVDGKPVNIYRADYLLRGIPVDAGQHDIKIYYRPMSFIVGLAITGAGLAIILMFIIIRAIRNNNRNRL